MDIVILSLFPEYFSPIFDTSIMGRAVAAGVVTPHIVNIRDFADGAHRVTDDRPFGGGAGMVMKVEPIDRALSHVKENILKPGASIKVLLTAAKGVQFTQQLAQQLAREDALIIICGHYEGVDERVAEHLIDYEVRIGDYVLSGGEPAAAVISDAVIRLLPGTLGNSESLTGESHEQPGKLGYPQYTRPEIYKNWRVPAALMGGNHAAIARWREEHRNMSGQ